MYLIHRPYPFLLISSLLLLLINVNCSGASSIPGLPLVRATNQLHNPASANLPPPIPTHRSLLYRLFGRLSLASSSHASTKDSLIRGVDDHSRLFEGLKGYKDQVVIRFNISTIQHEAALRKVIDRMLLDVWQFTEEFVDIRLPGRRVRYLTRALPSSLRENHSILIPDLARAAAATYPSHYALTDAYQLYSRGITPTDDVLHKRQDVADIFFQDYQPYTVIVAWMRLVDSMFRRQGLVQMISIGKSYEGRDIPALRVGIRPDEDVPGRRREVVLVTGGIHAREWVSTSSVNYAAWSFIQSMDSDPMVKKILERFDLVFIPVLNPDGYEYTWNVDRLWRKSRQRTKMSYCPGFDLDHAFGYGWDSFEHQNEPCSESYGGDEPFQAVEAAQLADWAKNEVANGSKFVGYLDLHSYSQQVLVPYTFSCTTYPPNIENLEEVAMNLAKHMRLSNGEIYTVASACEGAVTSPLNPVRTRIEAKGGSAIDYIYHEIGAHYSYQIKLRDTGSYGFLLPSDDIVPTGDEVFQAMKYLGDHLLGNNGHEWWQETYAGDELAGPEPVSGDNKESIIELRRRSQGSSTRDRGT